jgi:hypothetical protein
MAEYHISSLPNPIVIRPSGIWNTRSPLHAFRKIQKSHQRAYDITILAHERINHDLLKAREAGILLKDYLVVPDRHRSERTWRSYEKAQVRRNLNGELSKPAYGHVRNDLLVAGVFMRRSALLSTLALLEQYINCWMLNLLLTKLERGDSWTAFERHFAERVSPVHVHGHGTNPNLSQIFKSVEEIRSCLSSLPYDSRLPKVLLGSDHSFSAYDALSFWRQYRNCLVHNGGFCTPRLYERQLDFWTRGMNHYPGDVFEERLPLPLSPELLVYCRRIVYQSVVALEKVLEDLSSGRRGHPWAPEKRPGPDAVPPKEVPDLLVTGDHSDSFNWVTNEAFRQSFIRKPAQNIRA